MNVALVHGGAAKPWYSFITLPFMGTTTVCNNASTRDMYLTSVNNLIASIQGNTTYNAVVQFTAANFVAFVRNPVNQRLLSSNCSLFVSGLRKAKVADIEGRRMMQKIDRDIHERIRQLARIVLNSYANNDMDVNGEVYKK